MPQPVRLAATVDEVIDHAPGLRSLVLSPGRPVPRFKPGQFLHLAVDPWDPSSHWPDSRAFSVASAPESRDRLRVTVSEVGRFTARVMNVKAGDTVWLKLPYGEFVVESDETTPVVLVAGGTGVAPFVSLVTSTVALNGPVRLLYGVRHPDLLIYGAALDAAAGRSPLFSWQALVEEGESAAAAQGKLSVEAVLEAAHSMHASLTAAIYLSGPPRMIADLRAGLIDTAVEPERIHVDAWG